MILLTNDNKKRMPKSLRVGKNIKSSKYEKNIIIYNFDGGIFDGIV